MTSKCLSENLDTLALVHFLDFFQNIVLHFAHTRYAQQLFWIERSFRNGLAGFDRSANRHPWTQRLVGVQLMNDAFVLVGNDDFLAHRAMTRSMDVISPEICAMTATPFG